MQGRWEGDLNSPVVQPAWHTASRHYDASLCFPPPPFAPDSGVPSARSYDQKKVVLLHSNSEVTLLFLPPECFSQLST